MRLPKNRRPTPPGEIFLEEFLIPLEITQKDASEEGCVGAPADLLSSDERDCEG